MAPKMRPEIFWIKILLRLLCAQVTQCALCVLLLCHRNRSTHRYSCMHLFLKRKIPSKQFWKAKVLPIIKAPLPDNTAQVTCCSHAYTEPYFKRPALAQSIIPRFAWMKNNLTLEAKWLFSKLIINITN